MLDFTARPLPSLHDEPPASPAAGPGPFLSDLRAHARARRDTAASTRARYVSAIDKVGEILNTPLAAIPASLELVEARFPRNGFDPAQWSTDAAYRLFRRRLQAALREFLGVHAEQARLRALEDDWTRLLAAIEPLTEGRIGAGAAWHPMKFAALKSFALVARAYGWQPRDLGPAEARRIDADFRGNKQDSNRRSLQRLDELRRFPELLPYLPARPIGFRSAPRVPVLMALPAHWEAQVLPWIEAVTKSGWDPVSQVFADDHAGHAHVMRSAMRTFLRIGLDIGALAPDEIDLVPVLADDEAMCAIAGEMFERRLRAKKDGHLKPRSARKYLVVINQLRAHLGINTILIGQVLANNPVARKGKEADKCMTPENRKFCESLVENRPLRRRFLTSFLELRAAAEAILSQAALESRTMTKHEVSRVRMLGAAACFAAIEIGGAPIRVENAMGLTCTGEDAQIRIPKTGTKPIKVHIPAELTKNKATIEFPVRHNRLGCHDTIRWYLRVIRPLFPHAGSSRYLFPAVTAPGAHLNADFFAAEFAALMRTVVNLPMTPHQMRHGQTSLLLNRYPNEIDVIAKRIDDTPQTLRQYYGWINALKLVERGQDLLLELMDE